VIDKLLTFHREHETSPAVIVSDLKHAADQLPKSCQMDEKAKLQEVALKAQRSRQKGPQELGTLLVAVGANQLLEVAEARLECFRTNGDPGRLQR
jgi:hypothetical protein